MHTIASPQTLKEFAELIDKPNTVFYADTCISVRTGTTSGGLSFIRNFRDNFVQAGKKINIIHYVQDELLRKKQENESWAINTLNFIKRNKKIFQILPISEAEEELNQMPRMKKFADEALRRIALAQEAAHQHPVILTGDFDCALGIQSSVPNASIYIIQRSLQNAPQVQPIREFVNLKKSSYTAEKLPDILSQADIVLTSSALGSKALTDFLDMLNQSAPNNTKFPVYVHEASINKARKLPIEFQEISHRLHIVKDDAFYNDEEARLLATYSVRKHNRRIILVGHYTNLSRLQARMSEIDTHYCLGKRDSCQFFTLGSLGMLRPLKDLNDRSRDKTNYIDSTELLQSSASGAQATDTIQLVAKIMEEAYKGNPLAMNDLSRLYDTGYGVTHSKLMAYLWRNKSLRQKQATQQPRPHCFHNFTNTLTHLFTTIQDLTRFILKQHSQATSV